MNVSQDRRVNVDKYQWDNDQPIRDEITGTSLSIVIPTYNEADNVVEVTERIKEAVNDVEYEILIIDDDSPDNTWRIAQLKFEDDPEVHVHRRTENQGLARAVAYGIQHSSKEFCAVMDSDLQHPPEKLTELLFHAAYAEDDVDLVIASRHTDFGRIEQWPTSRRVISLVATGITKLLLPETRSISDPLSGFFLIKRELVNTDTLHPSGYKILLELLIRCDPDRVLEVPYVFRERERGESKLDGSEYTAFLSHIQSLRGVSE